MSDLLENKEVELDDNRLALETQAEKGMYVRCLEAIGDGGDKFTKDKDYELIGGKDETSWDSGVVINDQGEEVHIWVNPDNEVVASGAAPKFALVK